MGAFPGIDLDGIVAETHIAKPTVRAALHKMAQSGAVTVEEGRFRLVEATGPAQGVAA
ncbi:MAG: hypothetical protein ACR2ML_06210 [Solirubrobacteraceae bacterium]